MEMDKVIARINELYHKSKTEGLTEEEKKEQAEMRGIYIASIRNNLRSQLDNVSVVNPDGSVVDLADVAANKRKKGN